MARLWIVSISLVLLAGCRGGATARAAALPQAQNFGQLLVIAAFVIGLGWLIMKITGR